MRSNVAAIAHYYSRGYQVVLMYYQRLPPEQSGNESMFQKSPNRELSIY